MPKSDWFVHDRFGLFIHWGIYALPARHEWIKNRELISDEDYQKYFDHFDPDLYDPSVWAQEAKNAGMKAAWVNRKRTTEWSVSGRELLEPDYEFPTLDGLIDVLGL